MSFNMIDFIEKKRDGGRHTKAEFDALIRGVMDGSVPDYQTAAWLMAVYFRGLDGEELTQNTAPAASETKRRSSCCRSRRPAARTSRSSPAPASASRAARWTSSNQFPECVCTSSRTNLYPR